MEQVLWVSNPQSSSFYQDVPLFQYLYQNYTEKFGHLAGMPEIVAECQVTDMYYQRSRRMEGDPGKLYENVFWADLPSEIQAAYGVLLYDETAWNTGIEPATYVMYWDELTPEMQDAALLIGYNEEAWCEGYDSISCNWESTDDDKNPDQACQSRTNGNTVAYTCDGDHVHVCCNDSAIKNAFISNFGNCHKGSTDKDDGVTTTTTTTTPIPPRATTPFKPIPPYVTTPFTPIPPYATTTTTPIPPSAGNALTILFTLAYTTSNGDFDVSNYNELFVSYLNDNLVKVADDLKLLFPDMGVVRADTVYIITG